MVTQNADGLYKGTRYFALVVGIAFTFAGIGGFVPGITQPPPADALPLHVHMSYGYLLGLFPINILHNLFHFCVGLLGLAAYRKFSTALLFARGLAIVLGILTLMGFVPGLNTTFGFFPLYGHAIWLHGIEAVAALYLGFLSPVSMLGESAKNKVMENSLK
jgi:hypothetical protein